MADVTNFFHHLFHQPTNGEPLQHPPPPLDHLEHQHHLEETQTSIPNFFESLFFDIFERDGDHHCPYISNDSTEGIPPLETFESELEPSASKPGFGADSKFDADALDFACEGDEVSFITNLFERCTDVENENSESVTDMELGLVLGVGQSSDNMNFSEDSDSRVSSHKTQPERDEMESTERPIEVSLALGLGISRRESSAADLQPSESKDAASSASESTNPQGLRVASIDSDSDSEEIESFSIEYASHCDDFNGTRRVGVVSDFDQPPFCWDYLGFNNQRNNIEGHNAEVHEPEGDHDQDMYSELSDNRSDHNEGIDDVEVLFNQYQEREMELSSVVSDHDAVDEVDILFDRYHGREITIPSDDNEDRFFGDGLEEAVRDLEWEILLAVNNFSRDMHDALFGDVDIIEESLNDDPLRGSPPASKSFIEKLPVIDVASKVELEEGIVCAVCKDEILVEERPMQLPCSHYYHSDCIVPWLKMRNTCPVCRFELPTDDPEYECRKRRGDVTGEGFGRDDPQVTGYSGFHVFI